ncbi:MAG TPA: cytochrome b/b6 domain-containing protein [Ignavibacteriaceae bacterium]|nr:cytochrome b/b6 domain-containing protein [Ignavibacteriaceae bacterium]
MPNNLKSPKQIYIYKSFERFWHWTQAALIFFLALTGFEIHGSISFFGYKNAANYHIIAAYTFITLIIFAIFWHFTTGEWKQYLPTLKNIRAQIDFYLIGIFRNAPHPTKRTILSKLNPLQRLVYLGLKLLVIPIMVVSGLLYMFYRYPQKGSIRVLNIESIEPIALLHTIGAFLLIAFIIAHLYLITTGRTLTSNLKAMITGFEDMEEEEESNENNAKVQVQVQVQEQVQVQVQEEVPGFSRLNRDSPGQASQTNNKK